jgi:tight adherence protein C
VTVVAFLALLLLAVAVAFVFVAAFEPRVRRTENLGQIDAYGYAGQRESNLDVAPAHRTLDGLAAAIGDALSRRLTTLREAEIQRRLIAAGYFNVGARRFLGYRVLLTVGLPLLLIWLLVVASASAGEILVFALGGVGVGWFGPIFLLSRRARSRLQKIDDAMPELIDLLVVMLEAGVGFTAALRLASERLGGPLGEELRLTVQEQNLGLSTSAALENWMARSDTPAVNSFARAMLQGERLGISIGQILRNLAVEMRRRRRQAAEERAQKAAIKILFPLVFLIFPAMFLIVLGPAIFRIIDTLGGH